jgi:hypothetical protein
MGLDMYIESNKRSQVMAWRKANHIHGWFQRKLGEVVNCKKHPIKSSDIEDLLDVCIKVKDSLIAGGMYLKDTVVERTYNMAKGQWDDKVEPRPHFKNTKLALELLPAVDGPFFGDNSIDEWYLKDIEDTIETLTEVLSTKQTNERFYYLAWW